MRDFSKLLLAALAATIVLGAAVGTASARRLESSSIGFRIAFITPGEPVELFNVVCPVTLEGTFHERVIAKVSGQLIGVITTAMYNASACDGGRARFLQESLPWHIRYDSFEGALPGITGITHQVVGMSMLFEYRELPGVSCLFRTTAANPAKFNLEREANGVITGFRWLESASIPGASGPPCPARKRLYGFTSYTALGSTTRIIVRLVA